MKYLVARAVAAAVTVIIAVAGCGGSSGHKAAPAGGGINSRQAEKARPSLRLIWSHTDKFQGQTQVWYVVRVNNPSEAPVSAALNVRAVDASGTIVGSSQDTLPNLPAHSRFDYFGSLGDAFSQLTGVPKRITVSRASGAFGLAGGANLPMLAISEAKLSSGRRADTFSSAPYAYNLSAKVTNTTGGQIDGGVTQQAVLYDKAGHVVGGITGSSDNVPENLPTSMSYREVITGIPALRHATSVTYTVWPAD